MVDTDLAVAGLHLATDQSEALQYGLRHRHDDLLSMERDVRLIAEGRTTGRAVIDQAEDIRRAVRIYTTDHLPEIETALNRASLALDEARAEGTVPVDVASRLEQHIGAAGRETRRAGDGLEDVANALRRTAQALPGEEGLAETAQASVDTSATRLENVRRATFRVVEDLPVIEREIREMSSDDARPSPGGEPMNGPTPGQRSLGRDQERRRPPETSPQRSAGIGRGL
ncbi:MAG: hypothetical protein JWR55_381 [Aeromicrobium sp.]|jgi:chromosome segregation ATPase|nr:hypothetical protein [Aeromicrobium sp.]